MLGKNSSLRWWCWKCSISNYYPLLTGLMVFLSLGLFCLFVLLLSCFKQQKLDIKFLLITWKGQIWVDHCKFSVDCWLEGQQVWSHLPCFLPAIPFLMPYNYISNVMDFLSCTGKSVASPTEQEFSWNITGALPLRGRHCIIITGFSEKLHSVIFFSSCHVGKLTVFGELPCCPLAGPWKLSSRQQESVLQPLSQQ